MSGFRFAARKVRRWLPIILWTGGLTAQTCLVLSPATITPDGTALLDLTLYSFPRTAPSVVQWTFSYPSSSISSLTVDDGPTLTSVGKTAVCAGTANSYGCLALGLNRNAIANGVIAKVTALLAPGATRATIQLTNTLGGSAAGNPIPIFSSVRSDASARVSPDCKFLPPLRRPVGKK
jgi:hypothetical protein